MPKVIRMTVIERSEHRLHVPVADLADRIPADVLTDPGLLAGWLEENADQWEDGLDDETYYTCRGRQVTQARVEETDKLRLPYTVTVSGREREDGEKPYTWVVLAADAGEAEAKAKQIHAADVEADLADLRLEWLHAGVPGGNSGYHWNDVRDR